MPGIPTLLGPIVSVPGAPVLAAIPALVLLGLAALASSRTENGPAMTDEELAAQHQDERLRTFGQLAAGIAHEVNTPAQFAGDNVRFLRDAFSDLCGYIETVRKIRTELAALDDAGPLAERLDQAALDADLDYLLREIPNAVDQAADGLGRIARIVRAVKELSHPTTKEKQPADVNRLIESTATVCRNEWKYVARLELDLDPGLPPVPCHAEEISQVVLNLIVNAAHAIEARHGRDAGPEGLIRITTRQLPGDTVEIRVSDDGCGIPEEIRERVWERFFTTKPKGRGTGQGLAIARSVVVDRHGGSLTLESEVGRGTEFAVRIPVKEE